MPENPVNRVHLHATGTLKGEPVTVGLSYDPEARQGFLEIPGLEELRFSETELAVATAFLLQRNV